MTTPEIGKKFSIDHIEFNRFLIRCGLEYKVNVMDEFVVDDSLVDAYVALFYDLKADENRRIEERIKEEKADGLLCSVKGCRGRSIDVYKNKCVITTDVTLGSVLSSNALDGEKTIFYKDVVGVQFKKSGLTIGYLQLETPSQQMNNQESNAFSENTFTFENGKVDMNDIMIEVKKYIISRIEGYKYDSINEVPEDFSEEVKRKMYENPAIHL